MEFVVTSPLDMHLHLREGAMMERVTPLSAQHFAAAIIMPNLVPPVDHLSLALLTLTSTLPSLVTLLLTLQKPTSLLSERRVT